MSNKSALLKWTLIALFVAWFFFTVASYFVVYKPFSPLLLVQLGALNWLPLGNDWSALAGAAIDLLVALWLGVMGLGVGLWIWDGMFLTQRGKGAKEEKGREEGFERVVFGFGLGFGAVGLLVLLVGLLGGVNTAVLTTTAVILSLAALPKLVRQRVGWKRPSRSIAVYLIIVVFMAVTLAVLPPTSWDGLFYHLKGPKLYLDAGRIVGGIDIPHLSFPSLFQMWFLLAMGIRGDVAAQLIHLLFLFALGGMVYAFAQEHLKLKDEWTAVLFLYATPMVLTLSTWSYNDLGLAFFSAGSVYAFLKWQKEEIEHRLTQINTDKKKTSASSAKLSQMAFRVPMFWLGVSGVFAGLAMSMKYTSIVGPAALGLLLLWQFRRDWRAGVKPVLVFGGTAVLVLAPWLIKNALFTGNPVYPFLFGGLFWDEFRAAGYGNAGSGIGFDIIALLRLPYDMMLGLRDASQDGRTGALFLAFLPFVLFYAFRKKNGTTDFTDFTDEESNNLSNLRNLWLKNSYQTILLVSLAYYLFWVVGVMGSKGLWQTRLLLPMFTLLCPLLAWVLAAMREFDHPQFSLRRFLNMGLAFVLLLIGLNQLWEWLPAQPWAYLSGTETRDDYLTRRLGAHYAAMQALNEKLPPDAVVRFLWEPRSYYCDIDCRPDSILDAFDHLVYLHRDADGIATALRADGVTHVLIWQTGLDFIVDSPESQMGVNTFVLADFRTNHLQPVFSIADESYQLFALH